MKALLLLKAPILFLLLLSGCATVPKYQVWRPWIRELGSNNVAILGAQPGARVKTEVRGETAPLLGNEDLLQRQLKNEFESLLVRRGFIIDNSAYEYYFVLSYKTERNDKVESVSASDYSTGQWSYSGSGIGLGAAVALAVSAASQRVAASTVVINKEVPDFTHTLSIELFEASGVNVWKCEATWDSRELNILKKVQSNVQLLLSGLPSNQNIKPAAPAVKSTHIENYLKLTCEGRWFSCPALPYRIYFGKLSTDGHYELTGEIKNPEALAAYIDLVQTAEYAVPLGIKDWSNPLNGDLWKKVALGGQYLLEPKHQPVNILMIFTGQSDGYYLESCKTVTDQEYQNFQKNLNGWQAALKKYYDVFDH